MHKIDVKTVLSNPDVAPLLFAPICGSIPRVLVYRNTYGLLFRRHRVRRTRYRGALCQGYLEGCWRDIATASCIVTRCCGSGDESRGSSTTSLVN